MYASLQTVAYFYYVICYKKPHTRKSVRVKGEQ